MRLLLLIIWVSVIAGAQARIGETSLQFVDRYGGPRDTKLTKITDTQFPLVEGAIHHTYEYQGWRIRAAFLQLDGPAVRMDFQKMSGAASGLSIQDYELEAIKTANIPAGMTWKKILYDNPESPGDALSKLGQAYFAGVMGQKMWQRTDGAILWLRSQLIVRLELPAARQHEAKLKIGKDQKARASVPKF